MAYNFKEIEKRWQQKWETEGTFNAKNDYTNTKKWYGLIEFLYPSGQGLHVGYPRSYIAHFTEQLKALGFSFDWSRVINTTDPEYHKWTQWIFIQLYKKGLAYKTTCPHYGGEATRETGTMPQ